MRTLIPLRLQIRFIQFVVAALMAILFILANHKDAQEAVDTALGAGRLYHKTTQDLLDELQYQELS